MTAGELLDLVQDIVADDGPDIETNVVAVVRRRSNGGDVRDEVVIVVDEDT